MGDTTLLAQAIREHLPYTPFSDEPGLFHTYTDEAIPHLICAPTTINEAACIVELVHRHHCTIQARGGGTSSDLGGLSQAPDIELLTTGLTQLLGHEAPDLTCHIEAGMTLTTLQNHLARKGQKLALDPPDAEHATIGGILASNASGPKRLRYGTARDQVIGLRVIQADGTVTRSGGRVVKNVAGYDLNKLFVGSQGTLGIIVEANFKLQPLPASEQTLLLTYTNADDAMRTVTSLLGSAITPTALELIDSGAANSMNDCYGLHLPTNGYTLAVNFEGNHTALERQINETRLLARRLSALLGEELTNQDQDRFWHIIRQQQRDTLTCKISLLPSQIAPYLRILSSTCRQNALEAASIAHAGNGIVYTELRPADALPRLTATITALRHYVRSLQGNLIIERCPKELKRQIDVWGDPGSAFFMMQRLKEQFDPQGTFIKGRFLGGL